jgi:hypothetical protein
MSQPGGPPLAEPPRTTVTWEWQARSWAGRPRRLPWVGVLLILLGIVLLLGQTTTPFSSGTLLVGALAVAFAVDRIVNGARWSLLPAFFFGALAVSGGLADLGLIEGGGWTELILGVALILAWLVRRLEGGRRDWLLWLGLILALIGGVELAGRVQGFPALGDLWPLLLIVAGLAIVLAEWRRPRRL